MNNNSYKKIFFKNGMMPIPASLDICDSMPNLMVLCKKSGISLYATAETEVPVTMKNAIILRPNATDRFVMIPKSIANSYNFAKGVTRTRHLDGSVTYGIKAHKAVCACVPEIPEAFSDAIDYATKVVRSLGAQNRIKVGITGPVRVDVYVGDEDMLVVRPYNKARDAEVFDMKTLQGEYGRGASRMPKRSYSYIADSISGLGVLIYKGILDRWGVDENSSFIVYKTASGAIVVTPEKKCDLCGEESEKSVSGVSLDGDVADDKPFISDIVKKVDELEKCLEEKTRRVEELEKLNAEMSEKDKKMLEALKAACALCGLTIV